MTTLYRFSLVAIFFLDRAVKWWVLYILRCKGEGVFPTFSWTIFDVKLTASIVYVTNSGAAWGLLCEHPYLLNAFRICTIVAIFLGVRAKWGFSPLAHFLWLAIAIAATSNICDVIFYGYIIDMFLFQVNSWSFAAFNIADAVICLGWCGLFLLQVQNSSAKHQLH